MSVGSPFPEAVQNPPEPSGPCYGCSRAAVLTRLQDAAATILDKAGLDAECNSQVWERAAETWLDSIQPSWGPLCAACEDEYRAGED